MSSSLKKKLRKAEKAYKKSKVQDNSRNIKLKDGTYDLMVRKMKLDVVGEQEHLVCKTHQTVLSGRKKGMKFEKAFFLSSEVAMSIFKGYLNNLGIIVPTSLKKLAKTIRKIKNLKYVGSIKVNAKGYQNLYANRPLKKKKKHNTFGSSSSTSVSDVSIM